MRSPRMSQLDQVIRVLRLGSGKIGEYVSAPFLIKYRCKMQVSNTCVDGSEMVSAKEGFHFMDLQ